MLQRAITLIASKKFRTVLKRLIHWGTYSVLFAMLPLGTSILLHYVHDRTTADAVVRSPELLFFALMISAAALRDLHDIPQKRADLMLPILRSGLMISGFAAAVVYGVFLDAAFPEPASPTFILRMSHVTIWLAMFAAVLSFCAEILLGLIGR